MIIRHTLPALVACLLFVGWGCTTSSPSSNKSSTSPQPPNQPAPENALKVGVTPSGPPLIFKQEGQIAGIEADLAKELADSLGRPLQFVELNWRDQIPALLAGRIDIIMSGMSITRERSIRMAFSQPYLRTGQTVLVRRDDLRLYALGLPIPLPGKVGVERGTTGDYFLQRNYANTKRKEYSSPDAGAKALMRKHIDLFVHDAPTAWWLASQYESDNLVAANFLVTEEYLGWGMQKEDAAFQTQVNQFILNKQQSGQLNAVLRRWMPYLR